MPFTASHVAAALPFRRTALIPAAVVVGTMAPDIPYYVPLFVPRDVSHSLLGLVTIDLALALVGALVWWTFLREPVIDVLPRWFGVRIPAVGRADWRPTGWGWASTLGILVLSALVGGLTHLMWDSFTHPGWLVDHVAVLRQQLGPLPFEKWLQHLSSVAGLVIVGVWSFRHLRRAGSDPGRSTRFTSVSRAAAWTVIVVAGAGGGLVVWIRGIAVGVAPFDPNLVFLVARFGIGLGGAAAILVTLLWYVVLRPRAIVDEKTTSTR